MANTNHKLCTALHEAAHAVVYIVRNIPVTSVSIFYAPVMPGGIGGICNTESPGINDMTEEQLIGMLIGKRASPAMEVRLIKHGFSIDGERSVGLDGDEEYSKRFEDRLSNLGKNFSIQQSTDIVNKLIDHNILILDKLSLALIAKYESTNNQDKYISTMTEISELKEYVNFVNTNRFNI